MLGLQGLDTVSDEIGPNKVQVYKGWDATSNTGVDLLSESGIWSVPADAFSVSLSGNPIELREVITSTLTMEGDL